MKNLITLPILLLLGCQALAQNLISRESGGNSYFYTDIQTAIDASVNGDVIYLPGGNFTEDIIINKGVNIIGAGHNPDSSSATSSTKIFGNVRIIEGSDNGVLSGVFVEEYVRFGKNADSTAFVTGFKFNRVHFGTSEVGL